MSFKDSYGMRRIPGRIVREQKAKVPFDYYIFLACVYFTGMISGAVGCLMIWGFSK